MKLMTSKEFECMTLKVTWLPIRTIKRLECTQYMFCLLNWHGLIIALSHKILLLSLNAISLISLS